MIATCTACGTMFYTTTEDAHAPDCRCATCYRKVDPAGPVRDAAHLLGTMEEQMAAMEEDAESDGRGQRWE